MHSGARQLPIQHLSVRLPWHDTGWTGTVCQAPSKNSWCMVIGGIRDAVATISFGARWRDAGGRA